MKLALRFAVPLLFLSLLFVAPSTFGGSAAAAGKTYVCVACGLPCDTLKFDHPGTCPACGMALVEAGSAAANPAPDPNQKKVAILIFSGVEIIDYTGPYEMFGTAGCDVYTVAETKTPVTTAMGMMVVPKYSFADAPRPDVLVIPGGGVKTAANNPATLQYIKDVTAHDQTTMSVCNGAFILANTGLLDGLSATTTNGNIPRMSQQYPKIKVVRDQRYVDNGKIVTAAGLSAGIDGALHVIAKLYGTGTAQSVALAQEYDWKPAGGFARASLADQQIPQIDLDSVGKFEVVRTEGDTNHWDIVVSGTSKLAADELLKHVCGALEKGKWASDETGGASAGSRSWHFTGTDGKTWKGTLKVENSGTAAHEYTAAISIARTS